jgi:hypothetical protein
MKGRARRVEVPSSLAAPHSWGQGPGHDYASAFALAVERSDPPHTAEQWARAVFEGAPPLLRWPIVFGWRSFLRLRLHSLDAPDQVLGWSLEHAATGSDSVTLVADSPLLRAENIVSVDRTVVLWVTVVHFEGRTGRMLWTASSALHHVLIPYLLGRAGRPHRGGVGWPAR